MSIQTPLPNYPKSSSPRRGGSVQKSFEDVVVEDAEKHLERPVEVFASNEHRLGLKLGAPQKKPKVPLEAPYLYRASMNWPPAPAGSPLGSAE
jgi:hypothetical protein